MPPEAARKMSHCDFKRGISGDIAVDNWTFLCVLSNIFGFVATIMARNCLEYPRVSLSIYGTWGVLACFSSLFWLCSTFIVCFTLMADLDEMVAKWRISQFDLPENPRICCSRLHKQSRGSHAQKNTLLHFWCYSLWELKLVIQTIHL